MTPLDLLWSALAFLAAVFGLWLVCCFVIVAIAVWKPRGKSFKARPGIDFVDQAMRDSYRDAVETVRGDR